MYILEVIKNVFLLLDKSTKKKYIGLQVFFLLSALIQIAGVASIAPFIGIISNPDIIHSNAILSTAYDSLHFTSDNEFIMAFAITSLVMIIISNLIAGITLWLAFRFSIHVGNKLQNDLLHSLLNREFIFHKTNNSSNAIALVNQEAPRFVYMVLQPFLTLTSQLFIALIILIGLIVLDPFIASIAGTIIGGAYFITYLLLKRSLLRHGKIISTRNTGVQATLSEAFIGIKEIILGSKENTYIKRFEKFNRRGLVSHSFIALAGDLPKLIIETISFAAILLLAISLLLSESDASRIVSILSLYGLAGYKLLPAMQQVYKSLTSISANGAVVIRLATELQHHTTDKTKHTSPYKGDIRSIELDDISFSYPKTTQKAIDSITATFHIGHINAIAGSSGSGKSTLCDIALGLLSPSSGELKINNAPIDTQDISRFQSVIGYVPQNIFLTDESVVSNIAFGVEHNEINDAKIKRALELANASEFVRNLPQGADTILGQDGKLLSGGQRQRIGIARALYHDTKILVLDEPTSALDIHSEHEFMKCLHELKNDILIILISHSPSAIKNSDNIYIIDKGKLTDNGTYNKLMNTSNNFKKMMSKANMQVNSTKQ